MENLVGKKVRVDRGPETMIGRLMAVKKDHLVMLTDDGMVYAQTFHVKSVTVDSKDYTDTEVKPEGELEQEQPMMTYIDAESIDKVLYEMKHSWVQVNRGGPHRMEGVLGDVQDGYITLINNHEIHTIFNFHLKSISYGKKQENKDNNKQGEGNKEGKDNKKDKK